MFSQRRRFLNNIKNAQLYAIHFSWRKNVSVFWSLNKKLLYFVWKLQLSDYFNQQFQLSQSSHYFKEKLQLMTTPTRLPHSTSHLRWDQKLTKNLPSFSKKDQKLWKKITKIDQHPMQLQTYHIFVIFGTLPNFLACKKSAKMCVNSRQNSVNLC